MKTRLLTALSVVVLSTTALHAASFVVGDDRAFIHKARAIVIGSALASHTQLDSRGGIETVTTFSIAEVLKGRIDSDAIEIHELGGAYGDKVTMIPGVPRFEDGERVLLFLIRSDAGRWQVLDFTLGKFSFAADTLGHDVVIRDVEGSMILDVDGSQHRESRRSADQFINYIRNTAKGAPTKENYVIPSWPLTTETVPRFVTPQRLIPRPLAFTATSYALTSGGFGFRWNVFPTPVPWFTVGTEPGAPGSPAGSAAVTASFSAWAGVSSTQINYTYAGADVSGLHHGGPNMSDGQSSVEFEFNFGSDYNCASGGLLGIGGITLASGTHTGPDGATWFSTLEGDVGMNKGIANCTSLFNSGDWNSAVMHEVGHSLGFRHSDGLSSGSGACVPSASNECSSSAIMTASITHGLNGVAQTWDQHAAQAIYPGAGVPPPAAPTGVTATGQTSTSVFVSWNVSATATSYQIFRKAAGGVFVQVGTSMTLNFTDSPVAANSAFQYRVRAVNAGGPSGDSASDLATTVMFNDDPLIAGTAVVQALHLAQQRTAIDAVRALAGIGAGFYSNSGAAGTVIRAADVTEMRTNLDTAMSLLGLTTGGYTDDTSLSGIAVKAVHFQEIRTRMK
jgi:hypothetical protein